MDNQHYDKLKAIVDKCDRCGACTTVCPLYKVNSIDRATSRGKIAIVRAFLEGKLDGGEKALREALDYCLLCKACTEVCPGKVMTDQAMIEIRQWLREEHGLPAKYRVIGNLMASRPLKNVGRPAIGVAQALKFPRLTRGLLPFNHEGPTILDHCGPATLKNLKNAKSRATVDLSHVHRVAYFRGCAMKMFFPKASQATVELIKKTGRQVDTPAVNCCGLPQQSHGMVPLAKKMAKENIEALKDYDLIITDCGSCGSMLKEYAELFDDDFTMRSKARAFSQKIMGLTEYLYAVGYEPTPHKELKVTYHASCHLNRAQGINKEPEALLEKAVTYLPAEHSTMCCGGAGTFQIDFPDTSGKVLDYKYKDFKATGADIVVAECPSCLMQLGKMERYKDLKVLHISQVL
ncbi:MAG: (Fe-S)-binding protein [Peptococcaceae bacterium]|nr:(Fe-S)-binding protein [Peptococcaceae bacterium]